MGRADLDRSRFTPLERGRIRRVIEVAIDRSATWMVAAVLWFAACVPDPSVSNRGAGDALDSYLLGRAVVERALAAVGGAGALDRSGGLVLEGRGEWDLGVRLQGMRPFEPDPRPLRERVALDPAAGRVVHETRSAINPDAEEWLRYDYRPDGTYIVDLLTRQAFPAGEGGGSGIERTIPHRLLEEVLASGESVRDLGLSVLNGESRHAIVWTPPSGPALTLHFDTDTGLLREIAYVTDMPVRGDVGVLWRYERYRLVDGIGAYPAGYSIEIDGQPVRTVRWDEVSAGTGTDLLSEAADIRYPPPPGNAAAQANAEPVQSTGRFGIRDLAPGVFLLPNVRGGFHMLFIEFADFVLAVDAPAGWLELQELPAAIGFGPPGSTSVGARYLEAIASRVPDKPVDYVVLTHHHDDHAGGVRPFVESGATVLASAVTRPVVDSALAGSHTLAGHAREAMPPPLRFEPVTGDRTIADESMEVRLIDVGPNPHADGMLAVYLPRHSMLYVADLFEPAPEAAFPSPARLPVMRWFVRWLDESGLDPERIYSVHGRALVPPEQLDLIRSLPPDTLAPAG